MNNPFKNIDEAHQEANDQRKLAEKAAEIIASKRFSIRGFDGEEILKVSLSKDASGEDQITIEHSHKGESKVLKSVHVDYISVDEFLKWQENI